MIKLFNRKITICALVSILLFQSFSINSYAMTSQELPENFSDLTFEERYE